MLSKFLLSAIAAVVFVNVGFAATDDIVGKYACTGNDPTMTPSTFSGNIVVTKQGKQYLMAETDTVGNVSYTYNQFGLRHGNELVVAFQQANDLKVFGVEHMRIHAYGKNYEGMSLEGSFAYWNIPDQMGTERCTKVS